MTRAHKPIWRIVFCVQTQSQIIQTLRDQHCFTRFRYLPTEQWHPQQYFKLLYNQLLYKHTKLPPTPKYYFCCLLNSRPVSGRGLWIPLDIFLLAYECQLSQFRSLPLRLFSPGCAKLANAAVIVKPCWSFRLGSFKCYNWNTHLCCQQSQTHRGMCKTCLLFSLSFREKPRQPHSVRTRKLLDLGTGAMWARPGRRVQGSVSQVWQNHMGHLWFVCALSLLDL